MLSINVTDAAMPSAYPSPLTGNPDKRDAAFASSLFAPLGDSGKSNAGGVDPMIAGAPGGFEYGLGNFLQFETPNSGMLAHGMDGATSSLFQPFPGFMDAANGSDAAAMGMSPCTAAITQAAVAAMSAASSSGDSDGGASPLQHVNTAALMSPPLRDHLPTPTGVTNDTTALDLSLPTDFYLPNFHQYGRHQYDLATNPEMRRRERLSSLASTLSGALNSAAKQVKQEADTMDEQDQDELTSIPPHLLAAASSLDPTRQAELRRQIHIQSEQKRRAQIKDGFEELRKQLPNCVSKKVSKAVILSRTTVYMQQLKQHAVQLQQECERLAEENARLRRALGQ